MKRTILACAVFLAACVGVAAQEIVELSTGMKTAGTAFGALQKLEVKTGTETVRNAERLGGVYENMIAFWRQRNLAKAVKWSEEGKTAAVQLASAANSGDAERAAAAFSALGATCQSCHDAYREKLPNGSYRFKEPPPPPPANRK